MSKLALLGGKKIRTAPFAPQQDFGEKETKTGLLN